MRILSYFRIRKQFKTLWEDAVTYEGKYSQFRLKEGTWALGGNEADGNEQNEAGYFFTHEADFIDYSQDAFFYNLEKVGYTAMK